MGVVRVVWVVRVAVPPIGSTEPTLLATDDDVEGDGAG